MSDVQSIEYRDVEGFPGYRVDSDGTVWSCKKKGNHRVPLVAGVWKVMKPSLRPDGYLSVVLVNKGRRRTVLIHALVLELFVGERPNGYDSCHNNGVRGDNRLVNLRWDTRKNNHADKVGHGTSARGDTHGLHKLSAAAVMEIRRRHTEDGDSCYKLADEYGISKSQAQRIVNRQRWKHV